MKNKLSNQTVRFLKNIFAKFTIVIKPFSRFHRIKLWIARLFLSNYERQLITESLACNGREKIKSMGETANEDGRYCLTLYHYLLPDKSYEDCC